MNNERIQEIKRRWQAEMDAFQNHDIAYLLSEVERLQEEYKIMRYVLEWYADEDKYEIKRRLLGDFAPISLDKGANARTALSHLKG